MIMLYSIMFYGTIVAIHIQEEKGTNLEKINKYYVLRRKMLTSAPETLVKELNKV
jgi:hypothetical protein